LAERLPAFVPPMLARISGPFDSTGHLFEIKWDGIRALAFVEGGKCRLMSRRGSSISPRYPELEILSGLPGGLVLDGEIVVFQGERPDFEQLLSREQARKPINIQHLARRSPVTFVAFDLLYEGFEPILRLPLHERRRRLEKALAAARESPRLLLSAGVVGQGKAFYRSAVSRELEGVMAKDLESPYTPGKRSAAWTKIKRSQRAYCLIIGFISKGSGDLQSLLVAVEDGGQLRYAGRVGSGLRDAERDRLNGLLRARPRDTPLTDCPEKASWVEPGLYCTVSFLERTRSGILRTPVFEQLMVEGEDGRW
jgi:bifunctional non-homologous end joining protein LigD